MKKPLEKLIAELPPELVRQVEDYVLFLQERYYKNVKKSNYKYEWEGFLAAVYENQSALEVQKIAYSLWEEIDVSR